MPTSGNGPGALQAPESLSLPGGRTLPLDLVELLGFPRADLCRLLVLAGIETSQHLLELSADERRVTPGIGPARWRRVEERLRDAWGVELGCLAVERQQPIQPSAQRPGRALTATQRAIDEMYGSGGIQ